MAREIQRIYLRADILGDEDLFMEVGSETELGIVEKIEYKRDNGAFGYRQPHVYVLTTGEGGEIVIPQRTIAYITTAEVHVKAKDPEAVEIPEGGEVV